MPAYLPDASADPNAYDEAMTLAPSSDALAMGQIFRDAQLTSKHPLEAMFAADAEKFDRDLERTTGFSGKLDPEEVKARFGVSVAQPVTEATAAYLSRQARERAFREDVLSRADLNPLQTLGASLAGGLVDPAGLPLLFAPELLGVRAGVEGALTARAGVRAGEAIVKTGRLANAGRGALAAGAEGLVGGALYEAPNYGLRRYSGEDDYTLGDSLANVLTAGLFGAGLGGIGGALHGPRVIGGVGEESRLGAAALALDAAAEDRPINVGGMIEAEQARARPTSEALSALDETAGEASLSARLLDEGTAVTTRGTEVPVRYALVELNDLVTSHDDDLARNPAFPPELQPRARERAGAMARNHALEAELNPKRLMLDAGAETGAPVVAPDGVVESGNGRTIALRRSAARGGEAWGRYQAELASRGFDTSGMDKPVLVRLRTQALSGERRAALTREMNADVTERLGAAEQAMADAAQLDGGMLSALDIEGAAGLREFARRFIARVAPDAQNTLVAADGSLSKAGAERVKAALMAHAYGDPRLVEALFEAADPNIKAIGQALSEASPEWAALRASIEKGDTPAELDLTGALRSAVDLVRWARDSGRPVGEAIAERLGQTEMFGGEAISAETEAFLRLFYRDEAFRRPRAADSIAAALKDYSRQAQAVTPGPDLFGGAPDAGTARDILAGLAERFAASAEGGAAEPAGLDFRAAGDVVERPRLRPEGGGGAGREGGGDQPGQVAGGDPFAAPRLEGRPLRDNHLGDLGRRAERLYRETSLDRLELFLPTGRASDDAHTGGDVYMADTPDLALGQGSNRGALMVFDAAGLQGKVDTSKPAGATGYETGAGAEYIARYNPASKYKSALRAFRIMKDAEARPYVRERMRPLLKALEAEGWVKSEGDGYVQYERPAKSAPDGSKAPAGSENLGAPATKQGGEASGGESPADKIIQSDPELKALHDDTEALMAATGVELPAGVGRDDPSIVAEAFRAAAMCLSGAFE